MLELSIAMSIVDMAREEAERRGVRVEAVHLRVGPLSGVAARALRDRFSCLDSPIMRLHQSRDQRERRTTQTVQQD